MKAYVYVRVSSDSQAKKDLSIPSQLKLIREYAQKHNIQIVKEYADEGESALSVNRPNFLKMIADAKKNKEGISAILVWKLSRFARNREDSILYKALLKKRGIQVISISEPIDDSPSGKLLEGMIEVIDEFYSNNLSQETLRGMIENARRGYKNGGFAPFGYKNKRVFDEKGNPKTKLEIEPSEAEIVKTIFKLYLQGYGTKNIARYLNERNLTPRKVNYWTKTRIGEILKNEVYLGWTVFNKKDKRHSKRLKPRSEWIIVKDTHPKIINERVFYQVQRLLEKRSPKETHPRTVSSKYLLSGLLRCGKCGQAMTVSGYGKNKKYAYYNCTNYTKRGKSFCSGRRIRADILDREILQKVKERIFSEENIRHLVNDVNKIVENLLNGHTKEVTQLKKELAGIQIRLMRHYEAIENGGIDFQFVAERLRELKEQEKKIREKLNYYEELKNRARKLRVDENMLLGLKKELENVFVGEDIYQKREFLGKFIDKVVVNDDIIKVLYYTPNPYGTGAYKELEEVSLSEVATIEKEWLPG